MAGYGGWWAFVGQNIVGMMNNMMTNTQFLTDGMTPPPLPTALISWLLMGQTSGPFDGNTFWTQTALSGQLLSSSLVWKPGK